VKDIARLLHNFLRRSRRSAADIERFYPFVEQLTRDIRSRLLPPNPLAHVHLLAIYKLLRKYDAGYEFWKWLSHKDANYVDQMVYGAAIELLAEQGKASLTELEELYLQGLGRLSNPFASYHLSPEAIVPDRSQPIMISGIPMVLLQGIMTARLLQRDWKGAYLALDTACRLYPTQVPRRFFDVFIAERPIKEGYTVFLLACRSGILLPPRTLVRLLRHLTETMEKCDSLEGRLALLHGMVTAIHIYWGAGGSLNPQHGGALIDAFAHLLPHEGAGNTLRKQISFLAWTTAQDLETKIPGETSSLTNRLITLARRLDTHDLFDRTTLEVETRCGQYDEVTLRNLILAAAQFHETDLMEQYWNELVQSSEEIGRQLLYTDWVSLARATKQADHKEFFMTQCRKLEHTLTEGAKEQLLTILQEDDGLVQGRDRIEFESLPGDDFVERLNTLSNHIQEVRAMLREDPLVNFHEHSIPMFLDPSRMNLGAEDDLRAIYDELTLDPQQPPPTDENGSPLKPAVSPTGVPLDELRFQNWRTLTELMAEASVAEQEVERLIKQAIADGSSFRASPSALPFRLSEAPSGSDSEERPERVYPSRDQVRAKVLQLRRRSNAGFS
jgi:hypothetical protein